MIFNIFCLISGVCTIPKNTCIVWLKVSVAMYIMWVNRCIKHIHVLYYTRGNRFWHLQQQTHDPHKLSITIHTDTQVTRCEMNDKCGHHIKGPFHDFEMLFLWHCSVDIDKISWCSNFQSIRRLRLRVMHVLLYCTCCIGHYVVYFSCRHINT